MRWKVFLLCSCLLAGRTSAVAQDAPLSGTTITLTLKDIPLREALLQLARQTGLRLDYSPDLLPAEKHVSLSVVNMPLNQFLDLLLKGTGLEYTPVGHGVVIRRETALSRITISGFIRDGLTDERLIGACLYLPQLQTGVVTNAYGFYSMTVPAADSLDIDLSYVGYKPVSRRLGARHDIVLAAGMEHNDQQEEMSEMIVSPNEGEGNITRNRTSSVDLSSDMLRTAPSAGGNGDIIHSVQLLPGVQAGIEGMTGYSVRGGNTGQNIVLLDEAAIYNPSHLFGLVSIFNPGAVKYASFMKGGFPASYGDHISSVLDVAMKDGSSQATGGSVEAGTIASGGILYGPLSSGRSSYFIAARRSMIDAWLHPLAAGNYFSNYYFYDINAKLNFRLTGRDRLFAGIYRGMDRNDYSHDGSVDDGIRYHMDFGNFAVSLRWNHLFGKKLFSNTSVIYNHYHQQLSAVQQGYFAELYSGIRDMNLQSDVTWYLSPRHKLGTGADLLYQTLFPASVSDKVSAFNSYFPIHPSEVPQKNSLRVAVYAGDEMEWGQRWKIYAGIRAPFYHTPQVQYADLEPRLSVLHLFSSVTSLKVSYSRMHQYNHLVQSYNASFPAEIWIGSSVLVRPQVSDEFTAGFFRNFREHTIQASMEVYYKRMGHQSLFKGATSPVIDNSLEDKLIFGKGWSYGAEWMIRKNRGRWKGWLAYAYAYAWQRFDSLNRGKAFPFALDRRHSVYASMSYDLDPKWKLSADFFMTGGRAFTLHSSPANASGGTNPLYENEHEDDNPGTPPVQDETNNYRLSPYNRLDLGISYKRTHLRPRTSRPRESLWTLTVYNVYARYNTLFAYRAIDPVTKQATARQVSFIPVIPSLSYRLSF
ncbi:secretin and TonB N-terminal domain-containing protein [Flavitalea sp. BT771]|uniref:secretin and TonB N-terminal domain-containing protein n=1 Tax=Flavitalea sp. BT771 TaxID=3063329 RepID=UPI0026E459C7|nr:secretin and TonB N-terminal domain-containing protein [Flavitalea sp. BT771]MDO6432880.1 secretin and TonB N-terminal domain-containing protein [Flavitalea sp. BT771]MDV6221844.1 secretin and TonB N-terminal domain-containing protein [Flavitalea sp. BT771]